MRKLMGLKVALLVVSLLTMAAVPATAQLADPLSLAASGVLLPFFSDTANGHVSVFEVTSPVVPTVTGTTFPFDFTNPIHVVFFRENCARASSVSDTLTAKQAKAYISSAAPFSLNFNGLAAIAASLNGNDLVPLNFPLHTRTHWINTKSGRLRELEPIILDSFFTLNAAFLPLVVNFGAGASIGLCVATPPPGTTVSNNGFCWNPLRSAAAFVTPQESASIVATIYLICPTADIQSPTGTGVFPVSQGFPRLVNRDGSLGFPSRNVITGANSTALRGRIYDDNEFLARDIQFGCACLSQHPVLTLDGIYAAPPTNLGAFTVPVWYTELEVITVNPNPVVTGSAQQFSFTGYWGLEVTGHQGTLFHRMSNASLDNLTNGFNNAFGNR